MHNRIVLHRHLTSRTFDKLSKRNRADREKIEKERSEKKFKKKKRG
jgi:hypothetical protein